MSKKDFVDLYIQCYSGVKNEMIMRNSVDWINGRFARDTEVYNGALHSMAWIVFSQEDVILHFPVSDGRKVKATLFDIWSNPRMIYTQPGYYHLEIPNSSAGVVMVSVECQDASNEPDYEEALAIQDDVFLNDIGVGANDYEDYMSLAPAAKALGITEPSDMSGKEFFAIANAVHRANPISTKAEYLLVRTERMRASELDEIKMEALNELNLA